LVDTINIFRRKQSAIHPTSIHLVKDCRKTNPNEKFAPIQKLYPTKSRSKSMAGIYLLVSGGRRAASGAIFRAANYRGLPPSRLVKCPDPKIMAKPCINYRIKSLA